MLPLEAKNCKPRMTDNINRDDISDIDDDLDFIVNISYFVGPIVSQPGIFHAYFCPSMKLKDLNLHKTLHFCGICILILN